MCAFSATFLCTDRVRGFPRRSASWATTPRPVRVRPRVWLTRRNPSGHG
jgi:hypothetical protein